ncbi:MAG: sugar transferase, partial [Clostridia bacterium]|nr:sugar transferase [Clostridia bacterium]
LMPVLLAAGLLCFLLFGLYERRWDGLVPILRGVVAGVSVLAVATAALSYWSRGFAFPRTVILLSWSLQLPLVGLWRAVFWQIDRRLHGQRSLLVVASEQEAAGILQRILDLPGRWFRVEGVLLPEALDSLPDVLPSVEAVLIDPSIPQETRLRVLMAALEARRTVFLVPDIHDILLMRAETSQLDDLPVVQVMDLRLSAPAQVLKRAFDLAVAWPSLLLAAPVMALAALAIRLTSPGPVLYRQERVGKEGTTFHLLKFRTMTDGAEDTTGPVLAAADDPRVTPVGRWLRRFRLDELPQLWNVVRGEMSLVGPRPERPHFAREFEAAIPAYRWRHVVPPGLTGLAQVAGRYTTAPEDKLRYDLAYIRNYSLWLDLRILLQTLLVVASGEASRGQAEVPPERRAAVLAYLNGAWSHVREQAATREARR